MRLLPEEWQAAIAISVIVLGVIFLFNLSFDSQKEVERNLAQKCVSKASGSQPQCWDEEDWKVVCHNTNICVTE